ncbi:MAG TPA: 50S ribosomal protein L4 [Rhodothermales bacterium]|nr:50S ribosomal protein L4 [Rhodothermales bacterium]
MEVKVYRQDGSESGRTVTLDASIFGIAPNDHAIWLDVRSTQANARQGTHKTKDRAEVAGSTRKLYRQKGTGHARAGSAKSPIRRSGGTIFGPRPHAYTVNVNRKTKRLARRSALAYKAQADGAIRVLEGLEMNAPSTKQMAGLLQALDLAGRKVLILTDAVQPTVYKSSRNIPKLEVRDAASASTFDLLNAQVVVITENALPVLAHVLGSSEAEAAAA